VTVLPLEEVACQVAVDADDPAGGTLRPETTAAIENAESDAETVDRHRVRCTEEETRDLFEYFGRAAAALEVRGGYERSTSCGQAAELSKWKVSASIAALPVPAAAMPFNARGLLRDAPRLSS
jgi:hypothetical protein